MSSVPTRPYWPCYCEENVWHLVGDPDLAGRAGVYVAIISNPERQVALWGQRAALWPGGPIVWDYHVILLARDADAEWEVWDLDTSLGCPVPAAVYLEATFLALPDNETSAPLFRLLSAAEYRRELRTDRRHMLRADGTWSSPPPPWPPIGEGSNLLRFVDVEDDFLGEVVDEGGLRRWLAGGVREERRAAPGRPTTRGRSR